MNDATIDLYEAGVRAMREINEQQAKTIGRLVAERDDLLAACEEWLEIDGPHVSLDEQQKRWRGVVERMAAAVAKAKGGAR